MSTAVARALFVQSQRVEMLGLLQAGFGSRDKRRFRIELRGKAGTLHTAPVTWPRIDNCQAPSGLARGFEGLDKGLPDQVPVASAKLLNIAPGRKSPPTDGTEDLVLSD